MKNHTRWDSNRVRRMKGQALLESAGAMILISMLTVFAVVFVLNVGVAVYYKQKLSFAACQAAQAAVDACTWNNAIRPGVSDAEVETYTKDRTATILTALGLPPAEEINVNRTNEGVSVRIRLSNLQLIKSGLLPSFISIQESSASLFSSNEPPGLLCLRTGDPNAMEGNNESLVIPVYGRFSLRYSSPSRRPKNAVVPVGVAANLPTRFPNHHVWRIAFPQGLAFYNESTAEEAERERDKKFPPN